MSALWPGWIGTIFAAILLIVAVRAHERYWTLGFMGWRKVYAGLAFYLIGALLAIAYGWMPVTSSVSVRIAFPTLAALWTGLGLALVFAGSIERLRDLAEERARLEEVRAGFDLFDTLRDVVSGPYAFLEILDFSLKEMVRAAEASTGGLWLFNPSGREWVLTGAANMSQTFRQQIETVRGSGTGFDRLSRLHKAHVFSRPDEIRLFFPEWEAEGFRSILGLPLITGSSAAGERRVLGVIVLADQSEKRFDNDRARRLHAAADYVAAVVAEGRLIRQVEAIQKQAESQRTDAEQKLHATHQEADDLRGQLEETERTNQDELVALRASAESEKRRLESDSVERVAAVERRLQEATAIGDNLRQSFEEQLAEWTGRAEQWQSDLTAQNKEIAALRSQLEDERHAAADEQRRLREEIRSVRHEAADRARQWESERETQRRLQHDLTAAQERYAALQESTWATISHILTGLRSADPDLALREGMRHMLGQSTVWCHWRRDGSSARLTALYDRHGWRDPSEFPQLKPWSFEQATDSSGPFIIDDAVRWREMESAHDKSHRRLWDAYWGEESRPNWAICWPVASGWISAFGFGNQTLPSETQLESVSIQAALLGIVEGRSSDIDPLRETPPGTIESAPPSVMEDDSERDLHSAILEWVASQPSDEWHLELEAQGAPDVTTGPLEAILEMTRRICRTGDGDTSTQFSLRTQSHGDAVVLRMVNLSIASEDNGFSTHPVENDLVAWNHGDGRPAWLQSARWLTQGDTPVGIELLLAVDVPTDGAVVNEENHRHTLTCLVVDDQRPLAELVAGMLESLGHRAEISGEAHDAYQRFISGDIDVAIISADLPRNSGVHLAGWIKSHRPDAAVVLVTDTGGAGPAHQETTYWNRVLEKPFPLAQLSDCLQSLSSISAVDPANAVERAG